MEPSERAIWQIPVEHNLPIIGGNVMNFVEATYEPYHAGYDEGKRSYEHVKALFSAISENDEALRAGANFMLHSIIKPANDQTIASGVRSIHIIETKFGFYGQSKTLQETCVEFDITRERIRQIIVKSQSMLRHPLRREPLIAFLKDSK